MPTPWVIKMSRDHRRRLGIYGGAVTPWYRAGGAPSPSVAYQPKAAASHAASYTNLANPGTYDAALGVAPTWASATGWTFNGTTQWLTTGLNPGSGYTMLIQFANASGAGEHVVAGCADSGGTYRFYLRARSAALGQIYGYGNSFHAEAGVLTAGNMALAGTNAYLNGSLLGTAGTWVAAPVPIYIGCVNETGSVPIQQRSIAAEVSSFAVYPSTLTADQVAAVALAMAAL